MEEVKYYDHDNTLISKYYGDDDGYADRDDDTDVDDYYVDDDEYYDEECGSDCEFDLKKRKPIHDAILNDDVPEFAAKMKLLYDLDDLDGDLEGEPYTMEPRLCPTFVVKLIILHDAWKCATALFQLQTCVFVDLNLPFRDGTYPLHHVSKSFDYTFVELFLSHGARTDVTNEITRESNSLPLKEVLEELNSHLYLYDWTPEESIYKLVIILCLPQMKVALETVRLLALSTKHVDEFFIDYAKEGKLIEMAVLLLVANELVMAPTSFQNKNGAIRLAPVSQGILSQAEEDSEVSVCNGEKRSNLDSVCKGKRAAFTFILLEIFERTGDAIRCYLQSRQSQVVPKERVVKDVVSILNEAGFLLKEKDMDLSNIDCECAEIKSATGTSGDENIPFAYSYMIIHSQAEFEIRRRDKSVVAKQIASSLMEIGCLLNGNNIDLIGNVDCEGNAIKEATKESTRSSEYKSEEYHKMLPGLLDDRFFNEKLNPMGWPPKHKVYPGKVVKSSLSSDVLASHCFRPLSSFAVFQHQKNQFKGEKNVMQQRMRPSQSSRLLASHALSYVWGMRCV